MPKRPHKKKYRQSKFGRCPKCHKIIRPHQRRCKTCSLLLKT